MQLHPETTAAPSAPDTPATTSTSLDGDMFEYAPGSVIAITLFATDYSGSTKMTISCRVVRAITPFTRSAVLEVTFDVPGTISGRTEDQLRVLEDLIPPGETITYIIKLYDRRVMQNAALAEQEDDVDYTPRGSRLPSEEAERSTPVPDGSRNSSQDTAVTDTAATL